MHALYSVHVGLADWSAFLEQVLPTICKVMTETGNGAHEGHYMGDMGLIFTPVLVKCFLGPLKNLYSGLDYGLTAFSCNLVSD